MSYSGFPTGSLFQLFIFIFGCALEELLLSFYRCRRRHMRARSCVVCVWSSRFVNYIGPDQTCYTHTFYSLLNSSLFFLFFIILYIFYVHTRVYIRLHFSERLLSKRRLRSVSLFIFHHCSKYIHIHIYLLQIRLGNNRSDWRHWRYEHKHTLAHINDLYKLQYYTRPRRGTWSTFNG